MRLWVAHEGHVGVPQRNKRGLVISERGESTSIEVLEVADGGIPEHKEEARGR